MHGQELKKILTLDGVYNTILNDEYTFRWFLYFLADKKNMEKISNDHVMRLLWRKYKKISFLQLFFDITGLLVLVTSVAFSKWLWIFAALFFLGCSYVLNINKKKCIAKISRDILSSDYPEDVIFKMTLYQLCEEYSEKYKIISLVDAIYHLDKIYRFVLLFFLLVVFYVISIKIWWSRYAVVFIFYFAVKLIVNSSLIYKKHK